jgi:AraC family transcriptional regulator
MIQPPLDHHYIALHLGGAKRVKRYGEISSRVCDVALDSVTIVPRGAGFRWHTQGPIEFAHLYIHPRRLERSLRETFDRDAKAVTIEPKIGLEDSVVAVLIKAMLDPGLNNGPDGLLARESLYEAVITRLIYLGLSQNVSAQPARNVLAPNVLKRLKEYINANLASSITLEDLATIAGLSRFHLCRAFGESTGYPPHAWIMQARLEMARRLLRDTNLTIADIAIQCGYANAAQFSTMFKRKIGITPSTWRRAG